jgi:probable F420-dependent oxidoreductase
MSAPDIGRLGVWGHLDTLGADAARAYVRRVEQLGFGALWVPETVGREPLTLLGMLAGETATLVLGTSVASIWGRDPQSTRMAALTLAEATGNRFVLGLGVSHPHLAEKLRGHTFDRPVSRMRDYLEAYRRAIIRAPALDGVDEPPVVLAALRERMTDLAATQADGAFPYLVTADRVRWIRGRLDAATGDRRPVLAVTLPVALEPDAGRGYLKPYLRTPAYQASWELQGFDAADWEPQVSDRLLAAMVATGSPREARARIDELVAAGADHVAIIPLAADGTTEDLATLEALMG